MYARYVERLWKEKERRMERMWQPRINEELSLQVKIICWTKNRLLLFYIQN